MECGGEPELHSDLISAARPSCTVAPEKYSGFQEMKPECSPSKAISECNDHLNFDISLREECPLNGKMTPCGFWWVQVESMGLNGLPLGSWFALQEALECPHLNVFWVCRSIKGRRLGKGGLIGGVKSMQNFWTSIVCIISSLWYYSSKSCANSLQLIGNDCS